MRAPLSACIALAYGAGLATGLSRFPAPTLVVVVLLPLVACPARLRIRLCLPILLAGHLAGGMARARDAGSCAARLAPGPVRLTLRAEEPIDAGGGGTRASVSSMPCEGTLAVRWPAHLAAPAGSKFAITGRWRGREARFGRPGGMLFATTAEPRGAEPRLGDHIRNYLHDTASRLYGRRASLVDALVLGRRADLDRDLLDDFAAAGLMHLLAISGFHLGLLAGWVFMLARLAGGSRPRAGMLAASFAVGYTVFLGWPAPAARAAALTVLLALERWRQRMPQAGALLGTTALAVLLVDPWAVLALGGWLSLSALWGAVTFAGWCRRRLGDSAVLVSLATSIGATLATAPITAAALGTVALGGVLLNLAAIPLAALTMPAVAASLLAGGIATWMAAPVAAGAGLGLGILQQLAHWGAALPGGHIAVPETLPSAVPWAILLLAATWALRQTTRTEALRRWAWLGVAGTWVWLAVGLVPEWGRRPDGGSELALHFLDVGQGDAVAIRTPGGHWVLVDGGPGGGGRDAGRSVVVPFLRRHGVRRLEAMVLSHAHADHLGGLPSVLDRIPAGEVLDPGQGTADPLYGGFLTQLDEVDTPWMRARRGDLFVLDSVRFQVLHPDTAWAEWGLDLNENSLVLMVEFRDFRAVLAGDAGVPAEAALAGRVGRADLLKVGHHGSRGSTGAEWLRELRPAAAIISVGQGNRYGHPAPEALTRLAAAAVEVFRTDQDGTIEVRTDGTSMTIHSRRGVITRTVSEP